jgi:hypothetical protein
LAGRVQDALFSYRLATRRDLLAELLHHERFEAQRPALMSQQMPGARPRHEPIRALRRARLVICSDGSVTLAGWYSGIPCGITDRAKIWLGEEVWPLDAVSRSEDFHAYGTDGVTHHEKNGCLLVVASRLASRPHIAARPFAFIETLRADWMLRSSPAASCAFARHLLIAPLQMLCVPFRATALWVDRRIHQRILRRRGVCLSCADTLVELGWEHRSWLDGPPPSHVVAVDLEVDLSGTVIRLADSYLARHQSVMRVHVPGRFLDAHSLHAGELAAKLGTEVVRARVDAQQHVRDLWYQTGRDDPFGGRHVAALRQALRRFKCYRQLPIRGGDASTARASVDAPVKKAV